MGIRVLISLALVLTGTAFARSETGLSPRIGIAQNWEVNANPSIRNAPDTRMPIKALRLPKAWVHLFGPGARDPDTRARIEDGDFVWFPVHSADEVHWQRLARILKEKGLDSRLYDLRITGMRSSSRSTFLPPMLPGRELSLRTSISNGFGPWNGAQEVDPMMGGFGVDYNKAVYADAATWAQEVGDYIRTSAHASDSAYIALTEWVTVTIKPEYMNWPLAHSYRDITPMRDSLLLPSFSTLDDERGAIVALLNSPGDPLNFWAEQDGGIRGKATADLFSESLIVMVAPHSQNSGLRLNDDLSLTGEAFFRDLGDTYFPQAVHAYLPARLRESWLQRFPKRMKPWAELAVRENDFSVYIPVAWTHGSYSGGYSTSKAIEAHTQAFQENFLRRLAQNSGLDIQELRSITSKLDSRNGYSYLILNTENETWRQLMENLKIYRTRLQSSPPGRPKPVSSESKPDGTSLLARAREVLRTFAIGGSLQSQKPLLPQLEAAAKSASEVYQKEILTHAAVLLDSHDPEVLTSQLGFLRSWPIVKRAMARLKDHCRGNESVQMALASMVGAYDYGSWKQRALEESLVVLKSCEITSEAVFRAAHRRAQLNRGVDFDFIKSFPSITRIPDDIAEPIRHQYDGYANNPKEHYLISYVGGLSLLVKDARYHDFIESVAQRVESHYKGKAEELREMIAKAKAPCESWLMRLWPFGRRGERS